MILAANPLCDVCRERTDGPLSTVTVETPVASRPHLPAELEGCACPDCIKRMKRSKKYRLFARRRAMLDHIERN